MGWTQKLVWGAAALIVVIVIVGFFTIPSEVPVPRQFDLDGWSSFSSRNISLGLFVFGALLSAVVLTLAINLYAYRWLPPFALAVMALLLITVARAIIWASGDAPFEQVVPLVG